MKPAILIVGHGSRDREGTREFRQLVDLFEAQDPGPLWSVAFSSLPNR
jgi:sirohydrochlorin ferrochelatase